MRGIIGYGGGGKGGDDSATAAIESPDSLHSISYARVLDLVSEGPIRGLVNGAQSIYLNETPLQNADGSYNFRGFRYDFRNGTQDQTYIPGFPEIENELGVSTELKSASPWVKSITNRQLNAIRLRLSLPAISQTDPANGNVGGYRIDYAVDLSTDGAAFVPVIVAAFSGKATSKYARSHRIELPKSSVSGWQIRVRRLTANANSNRIVDTTNIESYTEVIDAKLRYPVSAIIGMLIDASQFSGVPRRGFDLYGRIIQVPSNYDPITRVYSGPWDGTFKPEWTDNPAWCFRDLVLHDRYGIGHLIDTNQVDKWVLYRIGQYCDQLVPDGKGGMEPRFTCNLYLQDQAPAIKVLQDMASIFRGLSYWAGGSVVASADMATDPVYVYTAANVIGGKFLRSGTSRNTRYSTALVSWNDPADFYRAKVEYVEDEEGLERYGVRPLELTAFGCTSQGQAQRAGRWALATSRLETDGIKFQVALDGAVAAPGQIVRIADPRRMGRRNGGRIRAVNGRVITVDKAPVIAVGDALTVILPSAISETRLVASIDGDDVTVASDYSEPPQAQSVWTVDNIDLMAPMYRIASVTEKDKLTFEITATQHEPGKFALVDEGTKIAPRPQSVVPMRYQVPPLNLRLSTHDTVAQGQSTTTMVIAWDAPDKATAYLVEWRRDLGEWVDAGRTASLSMEVRGIYAGEYVVRVRAVNAINVASRAAETPSTSLTGNSGPPSNVPWFFIDGDVLSWGQITDAELAGYVIRYHAGINQSWGDANPLHTGILVGSPYQALNRPAGQITLMIKAVNRAGAVSASPTVIQTEFGDTLVDNVVEDFDFQEMGYPGHIAGGAVTDGVLKADGTSIFYGNDVADFFGTIGDAPFFTDNYRAMTYETAVFTPSTVARGIKMTLDLDMQGSTQQIEYRVSGGEPFFNTDGDVPFYGADDAPFFGVEAVYQSWPGSVLVQPVQYQFRFSTGQGPTEGLIAACRAVIDVPDMEEQFNDLFIAAAGTRLPIGKRYLAIKNVQLTLEADGGSAVYAKWIDKNNTLGPLIKCFDINNNPVSGTLDARIQGY